MFHPRSPLTLSLAGALLLAAATVAPTFAEESSLPNDVTKAQIRGFVQDESADGHMAVTLSQLALQQSQNPDVLQFASRVLDERIPMTQSLLGAAAGSPYHAAEALTPQDSHTLDQLGLMSGAAFDQAYVTFMANQLQHDIHLTERDDQNMVHWKSWRYLADQMHPTLQRELGGAINLANSLGLNGATL